MRVLLFNGSSHTNGCTYTALKEVEGELKREGIETEILQIGTPVYFAHPSGQIQSVLDRMFYAGRDIFVHRLGAAVASARRGGTTASLDVLNKYFANDLMVIPGSTYWNMVHGMTPDEVREDKEGMQTMRNLGRNMAWIMKCIKAGAESGISLPNMEFENRTNFIR